mmetsp:Transcript_17860/g.63025  ORF Transcript_17860/g.63025 Transcript_17860/m.63025 type:complete len:491 (+) Transcript_17860:1883-3355(+)
MAHDGAGPLRPLYHPGRADCLHRVRVHGHPARRVLRHRPRAHPVPLHAAHVRQHVHHLLLLQHARYLVGHQGGQLVQRVAPPAAEGERRAGDRGGRGAGRDPEGRGHGARGEDVRARQGGGDAGGVARLEARPRQHAAEHRRAGRAGGGGGAGGGSEAQGRGGGRQGAAAARVRLRGLPHAAAGRVDRVQLGAHHGHHHVRVPEGVRLCARARHHVDARLPHHRLRPLHRQAVDAPLLALLLPHLLPVLQQEARAPHEQGPHPAGGHEGRRVVLWRGQGARRRLLGRARLAHVVARPEPRHDPQQRGAQRRVGLHGRPGRRLRHRPDRAAHGGRPLHALALVDAAARGAAQPDDDGGARPDVRVHGVHRRGAVRRARRRGRRRRRRRPHESQQGARHGDGRDEPHPGARRRGRPELREGDARAHVAVEAQPPQPALAAAHRAQPLQQRQQQREQQRQRQRQRQQQRQRERRRPQPDRTRHVAHARADDDG